ncbi:MmpS family transport accessory protein [Amycolatopsis sp.]|uniref:MmpS family transport accessory protein n=1 Tax=Amycolatopsis sp. TaxID=37632 RepID=UPI002CEE7C57|nr:MmpS family transport accessory protein [Amycolatopsis sp.]HVV10286.1 MmpS family transport accessory protein [Amycolatopsis sp.]
MGVVPVLPAPGKRRRRTGSGPAALMAGLAVVVAVGLITVLVAGQHSGAPSSSNMLGGTEVAVAPAPARIVAHTVQYQLDGGPDALNITYVADGAAIAQVAEAATPWSAVVQRHGTAGESQYYSLSAQNSGKGPLTCRIVVDGATVSEGAAADPHGMVRCSKSVD